LPVQNWATNNSWKAHTWRSWRSHLKQVTNEILPLSLPPWFIREAIEVACSLVPHAQPHQWRLKIGRWRSITQLVACFLPSMSYTWRWKQYTTPKRTSTRIHGVRSQRTPASTALPWLNPWMSLRADANK
jgi:hypothetical protein